MSFAGFRRTFKRWCTDSSRQTSGSRCLTFVVIRGAACLCIFLTPRSLELLWVGDACLPRDAKTSGRRDRILSALAVGARRLAHLRVATQDDISRPDRQVTLIDVIGRNRTTLRVVDVWNSPEMSVQLLTALSACTRLESYSKYPLYSPSLVPAQVGLIKRHAGTLTQLNLGRDYQAYRAALASPLSCLTKLSCDLRALPVTDGACFLPMLSQCNLFMQHPLDVLGFTLFRMFMIAPKLEALQLWSETWSETRPDEPPTRVDAHLAWTHASLQSLRVFFSLPRIPDLRLPALTSLDLEQVDLAILVAALPAVSAGLCKLTVRTCAPFAHLVLGDLAKLLVPMPSLTSVILGHLAGMLTPIVFKWSSVTELHVTLNAVASMLIVVTVLAAMPHLSSLSLLVLDTVPAPPCAAPDQSVVFHPALASLELHSSVLLTDVALRHLRCPSLLTFRDRSRRSDPLAVTAFLQHTRCLQELVVVSPYPRLPRNALPAVTKVSTGLISAIEAADLFCACPNVTSYRYLDFTSPLVLLSTLSAVLPPRLVDMDLGIYRTVATSSLVDLLLSRLTSLNVDSRRLLWRMRPKPVAD